jgi:Uncharacterized protein conserved in bacteria
MTRTFIHTREFDMRWKDIGLSDDELRALEDDLLVDPEAGDRMAGTGGIRKYRIALEGRGKSGGARVCYYDSPNTKRLFLITAYAKNEKENLSMLERNQLKQLVKQLR